MRMNIIVVCIVTLSDQKFATRTRSGSQLQLEIYIYKYINRTGSDYVK